MSSRPINVSVAANPSTDASVEGSATVFWDPPLSHAYPVQTYLIQGFIDGVAQTPLIDTLSGVRTKYTIRYLFYNTAYSFAVIARTAQGDSASSVSNTVTITIPAPSAPSQLYVTTVPELTQARIQWVDPVLHGPERLVGHSIVVYNLTDATQYTVSVP